jgi:hypothetical protein
MRAAALSALAALFLGACVHDERPPDERGASGLFSTTPEAKAPKVDRCAAHKSSAVGSSCQDAKYTAENYVRRLSTGDAVCLENLFGEVPGAACLARAVVRDVGSDQVLIKIEDAKPESRWYHRVSSDIWFDEGALVDLYLAERGY